MTQQYTNELTPEILAGLDKPHEYTPEELADMHPDARAAIENNAELCRQHPVTAIYRIAVAGSRTRLGGVADEFCTDPKKGYKVRLDNGQYASVLTEGCTVTYPDGRTAKIVSTAGDLHTFEERGIAVVESLLDNGDSIISTPQAGGILLAREGMPMPDNFLVMPGA